jgi:hypothetical protein
MREMLAALGAAAVQGLHAQAKPPVYQITEIEFLDRAAYERDLWPRRGREPVGQHARAIWRAIRLSRCKRRAANLRLPTTLTEAS